MDQTDDQLKLAKERTQLASERNRLAAERTLSAWLRTGLAGVGGGLAIIKFVFFKSPEKLQISYYSGIALVVWGIAVILYALLSYFRIIGRLTRIHADISGKVGLTLLVFILIILSLSLLYIVI